MREKRKTRFLGKMLNLSHVAVHYWKVANVRKLLGGGRGPLKKFLWPNLVYFTYVGHCKQPFMVSAWTFTCFIQLSIVGFLPLL